VVTESAKSRLERAVRIRESLSNVSNFLIYLYCEGKASEINNSYFISLDAQKCEQEDADFDVYIKTHFKTAERFQYTHFSSCHPASETAFKTAISQFKANLIERGYPETLVSTTLAEITFEERKPALQQKRKQDTRILSFVTQYRQSVNNLK